MTKENLQMKLEVMQTFEFKYNGITYIINAEKESNGNLKMFFGERDFKKEEFDNLTDLLAHAMVENHFFREVLEIL